MSAEDLTPEMCSDSSPFLGIKRAASSSEALASVETKKSKGSVDTADPVAKVSDDTDPSFSVIHFLSQRDALEIMSGIVKNISGLKSQVENIFSVLKLAVGDDRFVRHLGQLVANLLNDEDFHKAFVTAHIEDPSSEVLAVLEAYSIEKSDQERVEDLRRDVALGHVLQRRTDTIYFVREMVSIILGYWSSQSLCMMLHEAINRNDAAREVPRMTRIIKVDVPPTIEGLKEALATRFSGKELQRMCERSVDTADPMAKVLLSDFGFTPETVQFYPTFSVISSLAQKHGLEFMAGKVKNISRLKWQVENIFSVLKLAVGDNKFVDHLDQLIKNLLKDEAFHKAFVGTHIEYPNVLPLVEAYSMQKRDLERVECLRRDAALGFILQRKTDTIYFMREMLSILLGYWSSPWFCSKLRKAINGNDAAREIPRVTRIINVDVPPFIEGLIEALATRFCVEELLRMCDRIVRDKDLYEEGILSFDPTDTIKWFDVEWLDEEEFYIGRCGHYEHPYPGCSPM